MTSSAKNKVAALVLDESLGTPSVFPTIVPGTTFYPGQPVALTDLGLTEKEAREIAKAVPLVLTSVVGEPTEED